MTVLLVLLALAAAVPAALRWWRVAQREHYLPGSVLLFTGRWWGRLPVDLPLALVVLVAAALAWWPQEVVAAPAALAALAGVTLGPRGLTVRGRTGPLAWTARLRRVAAVTAAFPLAGAAWALVADLPGPAVAGAVAIPVWVEAALSALGPVERRLGERWVRQAADTLARSGARVVAVTGSYGKTTTKLAIAHLLEGRLAVVASPASFNNRMGLARAINEHLTPGTEVFVAEMGTYGPGEIAHLCSWVPPEVAVITAIGLVHLERMGSEEAIVAAKREILERASVAVVSLDHPLLEAVAVEERERRRVIGCSAVDPGADVFCDPATGKVRVEGRPVGAFDPRTGHAINVACAVGAVMGLGVDPAAVAHRLGSLPVPAHRLSTATAEAGFDIIDDTYNANPEGARAALRALERANGGRRVVVTPGMVELGRRQRPENAAFAREAAEVATDLVVVGSTNRAALVAGAAEAGMASVTVVTTRREAVEWVRARLGPGDVVLYENDLPDHYP